MNTSTKQGRNDPCHCGSGKKYKRCHLPLDERERLALEPRKAREQEWGRDDDEFKPGWGSDAPGFQNVFQGLKMLTESGLLKRDPKLRKIFKENETLFAYAGNTEQIEAALEKLEPYEEEFQTLFQQAESFSRRTEKLFSENSFAPLRFTSADVARAFQKVGVPPNSTVMKDVMEVCEKAILFLASKEQRDHLAMELMMRVPHYVEQGRHIDAHILWFAADVTSERVDDLNPFLSRMFFYGFEAWATQQDERQKGLIRKLGLSPGKGMDPDEIDAWLDEQLRDPSKKARLDEIMEGEPEMRAQLDASLAQLDLSMSTLLDREDADCILLKLEEFDPWQTFLNEMLQSIAEKHGLVGATKPTEAQQNDAFSKIILPAFREIAKGIFTPKRIGELLTALHAYRNHLFAAGEKTSVFYALNAINSVEREVDPSKNPFLINLCVRSLRRAEPDREDSPEL